MNWVWPISPAQAPRMADGAISPPIDDPQRIHQLGSKLRRAPAIIGQRRQRPKRLKIPDISSEVGFQAPDRNKHRSLDTIIMLDAGEEVGVAANQTLAFRDTKVIRHPGRKLLEGLLKDLLTTIMGNRIAVVSDVIEARRDRLLRNPLCNGLLLELLQPSREATRIATAALRLGKCRQAENRNHSDANANNQMHDASATPSDVERLARSRRGGKRAVVSPAGGA